MLTLSKGFKKPQTDDTGDVFFPAMETNIQQLNDHTHNGTDSSLVAMTTQNILAANWIDDGTRGEDNYYQVVTIAAPLTYDTVSISFKLSTGQNVYPTVTRLSSSTYEVVTNDITLSYIAMYTT